MTTDTKAQRRPPSHTYDAAQFRIDTWNELKLLAGRHIRRARAGKETESLHERITAQLDTLEQLEAYFAFPGVRTVRQLRGLFRRGHHGARAPDRARRAAFGR